MAFKRLGWIRRIALAGAIACLCALGTPGLGGPCFIARAEGAPEAQPGLEIDFSVKPETLVAPGDVTMTFVIHNSSDRPIQNITLTSEDGLLSEPIGQIAPGESQTLVRPHTVTEAELDAGFLNYTVSHDPPDADGEKVVHALKVPIGKVSARPGVDFTRQISSEYVARGGLVTVTYKIRNTGNVALSALRIRDSLGDFTGRLEQLAVGESRTFISRVTLNEEAESAPELEYVSAGGKSRSIALDPLPIHIAQSALNLSFSVSRSVFDADNADAILTLTNPGNADCTDITVEDDVYGGVIADVDAVPAGRAPVEIAYTYPLRGEGQFRWRVTGTSGTGEALDLRTDTVTLSAAPAEEAIQIALQATPRTPKINRAGVVTFDFTLSNSGTVSAQDALLYEVSRGEIRRLAVLPAGKPLTLSAGYRVDSDAQFIFCLNYDDVQGRPRTVSTAPIDIRIASDGETPEAPEGGGIDLEGGSVKMGGNSSTFVALLVIAGTALTVMFTILLVTSLRARRARRQRIAAERQRIKEEMGRTNPFTPIKSAPNPKKKKK